MEGKKMYVFDSGRTILKMLEEQGMLAPEMSKARPALIPMKKVEKYKSGRFKVHLRDGRELLFEDGQMMLQSIMESAKAMEFVLFA